MTTKKQLIAELEKLGIEYDPSATKDELALLLPEPSNAADDTDGRPGVDQQSTAIVQLTRNIAGRQIGETFTHEQAQQLGILDHCQHCQG